MMRVIRINGIVEHGVEHVSMRIEFSCEYIVPDLNNFLETLDGRYEKRSLSLVVQWLGKWSTC